MADHSIGGHHHHVSTVRPHDVGGVRISPSARTRLDANHDGAVSGRELDAGLRNGTVHVKDHVVVPSAKSIKPIALVDDTVKPNATPTKPKPPSIQPSDADTEALREDIKRVVRESYNPPAIQTEDATSRALRADMQRVVREALNPPKLTY